MKRCLLFFLLLMTGCSSAQVQMGSQNGNQVPVAVDVTLNPASISVGGTAHLTALLRMSDGSHNTDQSTVCSWTSSNTAVAKIVPGSTLAGGVGAGTATITCGLANFTGTAVLTVIANPIFTNPLQSACNTPPVVIPGGTSGLAYVGYQFTNSQGVAPTTYTVSAGSLPTGMSLSTVGVLSGTPSVVGTQTPTILYTAANGTASCQVSITIGSGSTCGPPTYPCTPANQTGAFAPTNIPFSGLGSPQTCPGTNCGADNTLVSDPEPVGGGNSGIPGLASLFHAPIKRVTNSFSGCGNGSGEATCPSSKQNASFAVSASDDDELHWNTDSTKFWITDSGSSKYVYNFNTSTMDSTLNCTNIGNSSLRVFQGMAWSRANNFTLYGLNNATDTGAGPILTSFDMRNTCPPTPVHVQDLSLAGSAFPSNATTCQPLTLSNASGFDGFQHYGDCFTVGAVQDTAQYAVEYHINGSGFAVITVYDTLAGTYKVCTNGTCGSSTAVVCQNCGTGVTNPGNWRIHNQKMTYDGQFLIMSVAGGTCTTTCYEANSPYFFQPSTGFVYVACNANLVPIVGTLGTCSGHFTEMYSHFINDPNANQLANKSMTLNTSAFFPTSRPCTLPSGGSWDLHLGNENNSGTTDDSPILAVSSEDSSAPNYTGCMEQEIMLYWPPSAVTVPASTIKRMSHTYVGLSSCFGSQQALSAISQDGRFVLFTSNMNGQLGCMNGAASGCIVSNNTPACNVGQNMSRGDVFVEPLQ